MFMRPCQLWVYNYENGIEEHSSEGISFQKEDTKEVTGLQEMLIALAQLIL